MGHPMRLEFTLAGLLVKLANHYTTRGAQISVNAYQKLSEKSYLLKDPHIYDKMNTKTPQE